MNLTNKLLFLASCLLICSCNGCGPDSVHPTANVFLTTVVFENPGGAQDSINIHWNLNLPTTLSGAEIRGASGFVNVTVDTQEIVLANSSQPKTYMSKLTFSDPLTGEVLNAITPNYDYNGHLTGIANVSFSAKSNFNTNTYLDYPNMPYLFSTTNNGTTKEYFRLLYPPSFNNGKIVSYTVLDSVIGLNGEIDTSRKFVYVIDTNTIGSYGIATNLDLYAFPTLWVLECAHANAASKFNDIATEFSIYHNGGDYINRVIISPVGALNYYRHDSLVASYHYRYMTNGEGQITQKVAIDDSGNTFTTW